MNHIVTSRKEILHISRNLIKEKGWAAVNIRSVASACNVSVGSIYNYFHSKSDLVGATIESVWCDIFHSQFCELYSMDLRKNGTRKQLISGFFYSAFHEFLRKG